MIYKHIKTENLYKVLSGGILRFGTTPIARLSHVSVRLHPDSGACFVEPRLSEVAAGHVVLYGGVLHFRDEAIADLCPLAIYMAIRDKQIWCRPSAEFFDARRFEQIAPTFL